MCYLLPFFQQLVQAQFFGSMKQLHPCVEDFSKESSKLLMDVIYVKTLNWPDIKLSTYSDLLRMADKYMVPGLENFVWTKFLEKVRSSYRNVRMEENCQLEINFLFQKITTIFIQKVKRDAGVDTLVESIDQLANRIFGEADWDLSQSAIGSLSCFRVRRIVW